MRLKRTSISLYVHIAFAHLETLLIEISGTDMFLLMVGTTIYHEASPKNAFNYYVLEGTGDVARAFPTVKEITNLTRSKIPAAALVNT